MAAAWKKRLRNEGTIVCQFLVQLRQADLPHPGRAPDGPSCLIGSRRLIGKSQEIDCGCSLGFLLSSGGTSPPCASCATGGAAPSPAAEPLRALRPFFEDDFLLSLSEEGLARRWVRRLRLGGGSETNPPGDTFCERVRMVERAAYTAENNR